MSPTPDEVHRLERGTPAYPAALEALLGEAAPAVLTVRGDPALLRHPLLALFSSVDVPADLLLPAYDLARALRDSGTPVIGPFQSPLERECLEYLLRGRQPVVIAPARGIEGMRLPAAWSDAVAEGRALVLSPFAGPRRPTQALAAERNRVVAALAERVFVVHASPGGRLHSVARDALAWRKPVRCFVHPQNLDLLLLGADPADPEHPLED